MVDSSFDLSCEAPLAHEKLVSVICYSFYEIRGGLGLTHFALVLAVDESQVRPVSAHSAFLPDTDLDAIARARCERRRDAAASNAEDDDRWIHEARCEVVLWTLGARGLSIRSANTVNGHVARSTVPYAALRDRIRADGPLAPVLTDREARFDRVAPEHATGWAVSGFGTEPRLVRRWMELEGERAEGLVVDDYGGGLARLVRPGADAAPARAIASALGAEATPIELGSTDGRVPRLAWDDWWVEPRARRPYTLRWVRSTEDLNLRRRTVGERRSETVLAVLPAGSLIAAVGGELERAGEYVRVVTTMGAGELASLHLRPHDGCVVGPGEDDRHVAQVRVREAGAARDGWLVVARRGPGSRITLHERDDGCALGEPILEATTERPAFDVRLTGTTRGGGHTLLVVGTGGEPRSSEARYRVWRLGLRRPVLDETFELRRSGADLAVRVSETVDGAYFPVTVASDGVRRFGWVDGALIVQPPPTPPE